MRWGGWYYKIGTEGNSDKSNTATATATIGCNNTNGLRRKDMEIHRSFASGNGSGRR